METQLPNLDLKRFTWSKNSRTLVASESDFGPLRDGQWWLGKLYDDSVDVGIAIKSHKTGLVKRFYLHKRDEERMVFHPVEKMSVVLEVILLND